MGATTRLLVSSYAATYCGVVVFWVLAEYVYPGTEYAAPWWPAFVVSTLLGPMVALVRIVVRITRQYRRNNKPGVD